MKKLVLQMEKQKVLYEEKALVALQKATQDKTEAVGKAATLQVKEILTAEICSHICTSVFFLGTRELVACDVHFPNTIASVSIFSRSTHKPVFVNHADTQVCVCPH